ncbi:hypothetical protein BUE93_20740 [Chromobacterium amazonense]|uniref:Uncharacterized protein n=1 Tax=Chromobacterium amazonense TaxID=1382803 RepID=A0A2S9WZ72_9NEIS|nr:hypothetical protein [Chromobacterium amazonense]PRP68696.1 hypothetical protein BUE93_20740 [Chromobacterium amazonense]
MSRMPRFKMHYSSDPDSPLRPRYYDEEFGPNIVDVQPRKRLSAGQIWTLFCAGLMGLAYLVVAVPLLGIVMLFLYHLLKVVIFGPGE